MKKRQKISKAKTILKSKMAFLRSQKTTKNYHIELGSTKSDKYKATNGAFAASHTE